MAELPLWTDWDDFTRMRIIAFYRHWFLFNEGGNPRVIKRQKVIDRKNSPVMEYCEEEVCQLQGKDASMTQEARDQLALAWAEYTNWQKANS